MAENIATKTTDKMLDAIRRELNSIIENSAGEKEVIPVNDKNVLPKEMSAEIIKSVDNIEYSPIIDPEVTVLQNDIKKMQLDLDKTYTLFRTISNKFENIDFSTLGARIRDMSLLKVAEHNGEDDASDAQDVRNLLDTSFRDKTLNKLTEKMSDRFRAHPGEFGDIPEVSSFFQACTQLQHGLEELKKKRHNMEDLEERLVNIAESKYQRIDEIRDLLKQKQENSDSKN